MRKVPLIEYAHDNPTFTQTVADSFDVLVKYNVGVKFGLTAIHTYDQDGRPIAKSGLHRVQKAGGRVIWDAKFADLAHQVRGAVTGTTQLGVYGLTVKALDDSVMLRAAVQARDTAYARILAALAEKDSEKKTPLRPILFGVTDLSSSSSADFEDSVLKRAERIAEAGLDGSVVPGPMLRSIRDQFPHLITLVVGVRPQWVDYIPNDDQKHTITHVEAAELGADHLVIGRPIYLAPNPLNALKQILYELNVE